MRRRDRVPEPPPTADRAALALWVALALLATMRAAVPFVPGTHLWAFGLQRHLAPLAAWLPWAAMAAALHPAVARRVLPAFEAAGDGLARGGWVATLAAGAAPALLVLVLPDRTWFVGDFFLRQATLEGSRGDVLFWYPYCLPLDLFLHDTLGRVVIRRFDLIANDYGRMIGAVEAVLLGVASARMARALGVKGAAALAGWSGLTLGGALTLYAGYGKAFTEMALLVVAAGTFGLEAVQGRRSLLAAGAVTAVSLFLHRSALGLLPGFAAAAWLAPRGAVGPRRRFASLAGGVLVAVALAVMSPTILAIVRRTDAVHFMPVEVQRLGWLGATFAPGRLLDLFDLLVMLVPLALPAVAMSLAAARVPGPRREFAFLLALALPLALAALLVHPTQGPMRDWDVFASPASALALLSAWLLARELGSRPERAWLAVAATLAVAGPGVQWLLHQHDRDRGLARVEALLAGPPRRGLHERASGWEFLGRRRADLGDLPGAADAFARSAELEPSPAAVRQWAAAEAMRGDFARARQVLRDLLARSPDHAPAWLELAMLSARLGDLDEARRAARRAVELDPARLPARELLDRLERAPPVPGASSP